MIKKRYVVEMCRKYAFIVVYSDAITHVCMKHIMFYTITISYYRGYLSVVVSLTLPRQFKDELPYHFNIIRDIVYHYMEIAGYQRIEIPVVVDSFQHYLFNIKVSRNENYYNIKLELLKLHETAVIDEMLNYIVSKIEETLI